MDCQAAGMTASTALQFVKWKIKNHGIVEFLRKSIEILNEYCYHIVVTCCEKTHSGRYKIAVRFCWVGLLFFYVKTIITHITHQYDDRII